MNYATIGSTGVRVSSLCFGTMSFGVEADANTSAQMYKLCRDKGINFFDTADFYSGGESEQILGKLMRGCRDELVIRPRSTSPSATQLTVTSTLKVCRVATL